MLPALEMSFLKALMPRSNCSRTCFNSYSNSFESFTCQEHNEKGQKFVNCAVINIYFNNKRKKFSTDSVMKDKVKTFRKDKEK